MNLRVISLFVSRSHKLTMQKNIGTGLITGQPFRGIKNHVRPMILSLRYRKLREELKNPVPKPPDHRSTFLEWNYNAELFAFGKRLNEEFDDSLLRQAFTDRSYVTKERLRHEEVGLKSEDFDLKDNEYMSSEGQNILKENLRKILKNEFPKFPQEGIEAVVEYLLTDISLGHISKHIGTKDLILCVDNPATDETLARAFRAIISVIEKTYGNERVKAFIQDFVVTQLYDKDINEIWDIKKPWAMLTNILQSKGDTFEPRILREAGKNTLLSVYIVGLYNSEKKLMGTGTGETIEIAQEMAARDALSILFETRFPRCNFKFLAERAHKSNLEDEREVPQLKASNY